MVDLLLQRGNELALAEEALAAARAGEGRLVVFEGPSGIGKTRMLAEGADLAAGCGFEVQDARGDELETGFAYGIIRQLASPVLRDPDPGTRAAVADGPGALVAALLDPMQLTADAPPAEASSVAYGFHWLVRELAEQRPRLLCVDDAQWSDIASLRVLDFLARRLDGLSIAVALAVRTPTEGEAGELLARIAAGSAAVRASLQPLGEDAVGELTARVLGHEQSARVRHAVWHATRGNPFLLRELLTTVRDAGDVDPSGLEKLVPDRIVRSVLDRLSSAGEAARALAEAVAMLGQSELGVATALAEMDIRDAVTAADRLSAAEILRPGHDLAFVHPIVREAVRADIPPVRRALAHARAARLLASRGASSEQIAGHLVESLPSVDRWTVETLLDTARGASERGSPETAVQLLGRARAEPPPPELASRVALELGTAQARAGKPGAVAMLEEALATARDESERGEAALRVARVLGMMGDIHGGLALLDEVGGPTTDSRPDLVPLEAELLGLARLHPDTRAEALERLERLRDVAFPPRPETAVLLSNLALSAVERNESPDTVVALANAAVAAGGLLEDESFQLQYGIGALVWVDRFDEAARIYDEMVETARRRGSLTLSGMGYALRSRVNLRRGLIRDAEADARIAFQLLADIDSLPGLPFARAHLANALLERGSLEEATRLLEDPRPAEKAMENPEFLDSLGRLRLGQSDLESARDLFLACGRALAGRGGVDAPGIIPWRSHAAQALTRLGTDEEARLLALQEVGLARASRVPGSIGESLTTLGLLVGGDEGVVLLRQAGEVLADSPRVLARMRALLALGKMLRHARRAKEARPHLRKALDLAHRHGATAVEDAAVVELRAAGAKPRREAIVGVGALTASERRVAGLAAQGLTNRQIAQQLFVSVRTVTTHLTHVYQKLQIQGRDELEIMLDAGR
jgi:DNA-binding CsgD family transcriptional regulator